MTHDPSHWADHFGHTLEHPELHLTYHLRSNWYVLYWLMRVDDGPILEVGCGTARGCILIKRLQPWRKVVALDIDPKVCEIAKEYIEKTGVDVKIVQGDAFRLPFSNDSFAIVFSSGLLEHYPDSVIIDGLKEQLRVAPVVIAHVPTDHYFYQRSREYGDERLVRKVEWLRLFAQAGSIAEVSFGGSPVEESEIMAALVRYV